MNRFFSAEEVNRGRQPELDVLKAVCIVCMILLHTYEDCAQEYNAISIFLEYTSIFIGAAAFMICMGVGMHYSRHQTPKDYLIRGWELLTVSQLLNLARCSVPNLIAYWLTGEQFHIANALLVVQTDILTFVGFAFFLTALLKHWKVPVPGILGIGFVLNILALILQPVTKSPDNYLLSQLLGFFVVTDAESYFPLLSYYVFVAFGFFIGEYYPRIRDKEALSTRVLQICLPVCVLYYAIRMNVEFPFLPDFGSDLQYILNPGPDALATCFVSLIILAVSYKILHAHGDKEPGIVKHLAGNINQYYCVSYVFILPMQTLLIAVWGDLMPGVLLPTVYGIFVLIACYFLIEFNNRTLHFGITGLKNPKRRVVFAAIWVLTVLVIAYSYPRITGEYANIWTEYLLP